jgi:hypothetical protein
VLDCLSQAWGGRLLLCLSGPALRWVALSVLTPLCTGDVLRSGVEEVRRAFGGWVGRRRRREAGVVVLLRSSVSTCRVAACLGIVVGCLLGFVSVVSKRWKGISNSVTNNPVTVPVVLENFNLIVPLGGTVRGQLLKGDATRKATVIQRRKPPRARTVAKEPMGPCWKSKSRKTSNDPRFERRSHIKMGLGRLRGGTVFGDFSDCHCCLGGQARFARPTTGVLDRQPCCALLRI